MKLRDMIVESKVAADITKAFNKKYFKIKASKSGKAEVIRIEYNDADGDKSWMKWTITDDAIKLDDEYGVSAADFLDVDPDSGYGDVSHDTWKKHGKGALDYWKTDAVDDLGIEPQ